MGEDATLDEFLDTDGEAGSTGDEGPTGDDHLEADDGPPGATTGDASPADTTATSSTAADAEHAGSNTGTDGPRVTSRFAADGELCGRCGRSSRRLWRGADGEFRCSDCVDWERR